MPDIDNVESNAVGIWTEANPDKINLLDIRNNISKLILSFNSSISFNTQKVDSKNLSLSMLLLIEKYFSHEEIANYKVSIVQKEIVNQYDYYFLFQKLDGASNPDELRTVMRYEINIYNHFCVMLNSALPTSHIKPQKKLAMKLFSLIQNKNVIYSDLINEYRERLKILHWKITNLNWTAFVISKMSEYDLDFFAVIIGFARSGKSTLALDLIRHGLSFKYKKPITDSFIQNQMKEIIQKNVAYTEKDRLDTAFRSQQKQPFLYDEGYLAADRRQSMALQQIQLSHLINTNAKQNNQTYLLIQSYPDLDRRFLGKANLLILIKERGIARCFVKSSNYPLIKDAISFEKFDKNPELLNTEEIADYTLEKLPSFVFKLSWANLDGSPDFEAYKAEKQRRQNPDSAINKPPNRLFSEEEAEKIMQLEKDNSLNLSV